MNAPVQLTAHARKALGPEVACEPYAPGRGLPLFVTPLDPALAHDLEAAAAWLREQVATIRREAAGQ